ncbi:MAG: cystathionine beta-lyase, partial [Alphaproteobacteria bacterium]|nr:cystathionine beta-lyase [Alphaproteobacteria bacterium]
FEHAAQNKFDLLVYGRFGTPTSKAFEEAIAEIEGGSDKYRTVAVTSGMAAIALGILAFVKSGDHVLAPDNVYGPTRNLGALFLERFGVEMEHYDPAIGAEIEQHIRPNTAVIYVEAPGSLTMEMPDIAAIVAVARKRDILTAFDNTWASPYFFRPFEHGIDISIMAATKYIVGHSDAMLGTITVAKERYDQLKTTTNILGNCPAPEDCYLGMRGLRTLGVRLKQHQINARTVADWLLDRPEVKQVRYPALPQDPGHTLWKRDFEGAAGLLTIVLNDCPKEAVAAMVDGYEHFKLGGSFGGYESLVLPVRVDALRTATTWDPGGPAVRFHVGLEDPDDLIADLEAGFARLTAAS